MSISPYQDEPQENWLEITRNLIDSHPLTVYEIIDIAHEAWEGVWSTSIMTRDAKISLYDISPPATVIGYLFEKLVAQILRNRYPGSWIGGQLGNEKDLHFLPNPYYSIEVKTSGQPGLKIFGNRSYGQEVANTSLAKKDKSGFYITVNFFGATLNLVRFGWIDGSDWRAQRSATGQMAGLDKSVYDLKLLPITGGYTLEAPISFLQGVGPKLVAELSQYGLHRIRDILANPDVVQKGYKRVYESAVQYANAFGSDQA